MIEISFAVSFQDFINSACNFFPFGTCVLTRGVMVSWQQTARWLNKLTRMLWARKHLWMPLLAYPANNGFYLKHFRQQPERVSAKSLRVRPRNGPRNRPGISAVEATAARQVWIWQTANVFRSWTFEAARNTVEIQRNERQTGKGLRIASPYLIECPWIENTLNFQKA